MTSLYDIKKKLLTLISNASSILQPEADHVLANWNVRYWESDTFPLVTVRLTISRQWMASYGGEITSNKHGEYIIYHFTTFIYAFNDTPKARTAQDLADLLIDYLSEHNKHSDVGIINIINLRYFESEPERGSNRLSRIILEGDIIAEVSIP